MSTYKLYKLYKKYTKYDLWKFDVSKNIKVWKIVFVFSNCLICFRNVRMFGNVFWHCWCVLHYKLLLWMRLSDSVWVSVYMNILQRYFSTFLENKFRSVNNFRTDLGGPKWAPPLPPSPASMSKFPSRRNKYEKNKFGCVFLSLVGS